MYLQCAHAFLRGQNQISDLEPASQWNLRVLKDCVRDDAESVSAILRAYDRLAFGIGCGLSALADPMKRARLECIDFGVPAARTGHALRPAYGLYGLAA